MKNHVQHKRKDKNKKLNSNRGKEQRTKIVQSITESGEESDAEELIESFVGSDFSDDNEGEGEPSTPPLSNILQPLHEADKGLFDDAVGSGDITSNDDYIEQTKSISDAQKLRTAKIRQRSKDAANTSNFIREQTATQQIAQDNNNSFKQMLMMMYSQNQRQIDEDREERKRQSELLRMEREERRQQMQQQQMFQNVMMMKLLGVSSSEANNLFNNKPNPSQNNSTMDNDNSNEL